MSEREEQLDGMPSEFLMDECRRLDAEIERLKAELAKAMADTEQAWNTAAKMRGLVKPYGLTEDDFSSWSEYSKAINAARQATEKSAISHGPECCCVGCV